MKPAFVLLLVIFSSGVLPLGSSSAATDKDTTTEASPRGPVVETILAMEKRLRAAFMEPDQGVFQDILAEDLVYIWYDGKVIRKADFLKPYKESKWRVTRFEPRNVKVRTFGSVAVVTMRVDRTWVGPDGESADGSAVTRVWSQSDAVWRLSSVQVTKVPPTGSSAAHHPPDATPTPPLGAEAQAILAMEERYKAGLLEPDEETFRDLLADDLIHIGSEGEIVDKAQYMDLFTRGKWWYKKYKPVGVRVRMYGTVGVVTGRVDRLMQANGKEIGGAFVFTHVWHSSNGAWRIASSHVTTVQ